MPFGQVVIGPPGSGKSTFCLAAADFMRASGRSVCLINLDPANDDLPYDCGIDIGDLVSLAAVQESTGLGPNGGLVFCMDFLHQNFDWLQVRAGAPATCLHSVPRWPCFSKRMHVYAYMIVVWLRVAQQQRTIVITIEVSRRSS